MLDQVLFIVLEYCLTNCRFTDFRCDHELQKRGNRFAAGQVEHQTVS